MGNAPLPPFDTPRWFVCHARPRCEKKFATLLASEDFEHYLPLILSLRRYQNQTKKFTKPLFPGYVFAQILPERKTRIYQGDLLVRVIPVENEALFLRQLADVRALASSGLEISLHPLLKKGTRVRIIGGPLHGTEGLVDNPANPRGVIVSMDVLQQGVLVRLPTESLQILP